MSFSLDSILSEASNFISSEFHLEVQKSKLKIYSAEDWKRFYEKNRGKVENFQLENEGLYTPKNYSAYVLYDSPFLVCNVFHEFFGHGLFCEHSQIGKNLVGIVEENKRYDTFLYGKIDPHNQPLGFTCYNITNYEGFAMWLESLVCKETGNKWLWEAKKRSLPPSYVELLEFFNQAEQKFTRFGFMAQLGFPKCYNSEKVVDILKLIYASHFGDIRFIILYGSQKPESDIDVLVVTDSESVNFFNGWLDIFQLNKEDFEEWVDKLDVSVTDPLFTGTLIYGDKDYYEASKQVVMKKVITEKQINHNLSRAEKATSYLSRKNTAREEKIFLSYAKSYTKTAEELKNGNKVLTLKRIKELSPV